MSEFNEIILRGSDLERERNCGYTQGSDVPNFDRRKTMVDIYFDLIEEKPFHDIRITFVKDLIIEIVEQDGNALEFASESLQEDRHIVKEADEQNEKSLAFSSKGAD